MVDAVHVACACADQCGDRQAWTEADLEDPVGGLHTEQRDRPAAALPVGRAVGVLPWPQSRPSSAPEVNTPDAVLTIGELARRAGVSPSALRYYEELGLLPAPARISGQRRYPESAARLVGAILLYSDAGFTLAEQKAIMASRDGTRDEWSRLARRKLAELDEQIARAQAAREAIRHGLRCPHEDVTHCANFNAGITARLAGRPSAQSHRELHGPGE